ncbi:c2h2-like zinc finger protein [Anaeramoeba flamelloides]|uniref:C2h2-like zinc finger protein n=1 Tax=Anaeramoeba flamelloides TaxID=1746091 RepID=A0AAV8A3B1_9EUKA|nr:c2h2-like zinc finger protein [Anaeramoeba flamelloides]
MNNKIYWLNKNARDHNKTRNMLNKKYYHVRVYTKIKSLANAQKTTPLKVIILSARTNYDNRLLNKMKKKKPKSTILVYEDNAKKIKQKKEKCKTNDLQLIQSKEELLEIIQRYLPQSNEYSSTTTSSTSSSIELSCSDQSSSDTFVNSNSESTNTERNKRKKKKKQKRSDCSVISSDFSDYSEQETTSPHVTDEEELEKQDDFSELEKYNGIVIWMNRKQSPKKIILKSQNSLSYELKKRSCKVIENKKPIDAIDYYKRIKRANNAKIKIKLVICEYDDVRQLVVTEEFGCSVIIWDPSWNQKVKIDEYQFKKRQLTEIFDRGAKYLASDAEELLHVIQLVIANKSLENEKKSLVTRLQGSVISPRGNKKTKTKKIKKNKQKGNNQKAQVSKNALTICWLARDHSYNERLIFDLAELQVTNQKFSQTSRLMDYIRNYQSTILLVISQSWYIENDKLTQQIRNGCNTKIPVWILAKRNEKNLAYMCRKGKAKHVFYNGYDLLQQIYPLLQSRIQKKFLTIQLSNNSSPLLLPQITSPYLVKASQLDFDSIKNQFETKWIKKQTGNPKVVNIFRIKATSNLVSRYLKYQQKIITDDPTLKNGYEGKFGKGNERRRFHGSTIACTLGMGGNMRPCNKKNCSICSIITHGFDINLCGSNKSFNRFGLGLYFSSVSGKSHDYTTIVPPAKYHTILVCYCLCGNSYSLKLTSTKLIKPPQGYHSIVGDVGQDLNYDEIVLYQNDSVLPFYIVQYNVI